ncbi:MAG: response regulator [bacterium]
MSKPKLIIIEDETIIAIGLRKRFQSLGYEVCNVVSRSEEIMASVEKEKPDLILMDINIQGKKDGIELAKEIKATFNTPIVFLSGYADTEMKRRANMVNHSGLFEKPVEIQVLHEAFQNALQQQA